MFRLPVIAGMIGAVLGYLVVMLGLSLVSFGNPHDPITTGMLVLLGLAPAGAIGGLILGTRLGMQMRGEDAAGLLRNFLKALALTLVTVAVIAGGITWYIVATATPWLKPMMTLDFEVRLPAGTKAPAGAREVKLELQTDLNTMPGELREVRSEDGRAVIVGKVELAYQTRYRQVEVKVAGQPDRVYPVKLAARPQTTPDLGAWQPHPDGSEIRYRAR